MKQNNLKGAFGERVSQSYQRASGAIVEKERAPNISHLRSIQYQTLAPLSLATKQSSSQIPSTVTYNKL